MKVMANRNLEFEAQKILQTKLKEKPWNIILSFLSRYTSGTFSSKRDSKREWFKNFLSVFKRQVCKDKKYFSA